MHLTRSSRADLPTDLPNAENRPDGPVFCVLKFILYRPHGRFVFVVDASSATGDLVAVVDAR